MLTVEQADGIVNSIMSLYTSDGYSPKQSHDDDHRELHQLPMEQGLRMGLNAILLCTAGAVELDVREKHLVIWPDEVMICPPLEIVANIQTSRNFECKILFLTDRILKEFLRRNTQMWNRALYVERIDIISLSKEEVRRFLCFYELVKGELAAEGTPYHKEEMQSMLLRTFATICLTPICPSSKSPTCSVSRIPLSSVLMFGSI